MILEALSSSPQSDSSLPAASAERAAWEDLFHRHAGRVRCAVRNALRARGERLDPDRVEDLEQEVWCRLLERQRLERTGPRREAEGETANYLRRVALTVVVDALRSENAVRRRPPASVALDVVGPQLADWRGCPERRLLARESLRRYFALCRDLLGARAGASQIGLLRLAWVVGHSSRAIVARLGAGWTVSGVDSLLFRLRRRLRDLGERLPVRPGDGVAPPAG